ncbi:MAG: T9SS type A sorting domain-containing protein, partial [Bacteroidales bacterium]|nr:T9SS type A sorting domain-containing protein [Bacteroidales bacterium]
LGARVFGETNLVSNTTIKVLKSKLSNYQATAWLDKAGNVTIEALTQPIDVAITGGANGTVSYSGGTEGFPGTTPADNATSFEAYEAEPVTITATPDGGKVATMYVDGVKVSSPYTINAVAQTGHKVKVVFSDPFKTWTGATDTNWGTAGNWEGVVVPGTTDNVLIPKVTRFPILIAATEVNSIRFEPGAEIGGQQHLTANAFVQYDLSYTPKTWRILSMPLTSATVGNFSFSGTPAAKFLTFKASGNHAGWQNMTSSNLGDPLSAGDAFAYGVESLTGALLVDQTLELSGQLQKTSFSKQYANGTDEIGSGGYFAVAGNPFMSTISYAALQTGTDINETGYYTWNGSTNAFVSQEKTVPIAPLQGFVVYGAGSGNFSLTFNPVTLATGAGGSTLKSSSEQAKLTVTASNGTGSSSTVILNRENGQATFNGRVDLPALMSDVSDVPQIYTLKQSASGASVALGINVVSSDDAAIPLGISTIGTGEVKLTFSGMDAYDATVTLHDRGQATDLTSQSAVEYTLTDYQPSADNSLYISFSPRSTTEAAAPSEAAATVYSSNGVVHALSAASIVSVSVYNLQGALVASSTVNAPSYACRVAPGIYAVRVVTAQGVQTVKLVVSD